MKSRVFLLLILTLLSVRIFSSPKNDYYFQWGFGLGLPYTTVLMDGLKGEPPLYPPVNLHIYGYKTLSLNCMLGIGLEYSDQAFSKKQITKDPSEIQDETGLDFIRFMIQFHYAFNEIGQGLFMNVAVGNGDMDLYKGDIDKASGLRLVKEENTLFLKGGIGYAFEREKTPPGEHWFFVIGIELNYAHGLSTNWKVLFSNFYISWFY